MKNIIFINTFYAPKIMNVIYWLAVLFNILSGLILIIEGYDAEERIQGLILLLFGPFVSRLLAEVIVVPFKIYEKVCKIYDKMAADEEKFQVEENKVAE